MSTATPPWRNFVAATAALAAGAAATAGLAADARSIGAALETPIQASWTRLPLGQWADRISGMTGVPVVVDRRLDRSVPITLESDGLPLSAVLHRVAQVVDADIEVLASSLRVVPPSEAGRATAVERDRDHALAALPADEQRRLSAAAAWEWPAGSPPRQLVSEVADAAGLTLSGLELIPHDHLPAARLPPLKVAERIDLVLNQFDLRAEWTSGGGRIAPLGSLPARAAPAGAGPRRTHGRQARPSTGDERFSLRLEAPLDQAVAAIARRFDLRPAIDAAGLTARGISTAEVVRVRVEEVSRERLFDAVVAPLGLSWAVEDGMLRVFAPERRAEAQ